LRDLQSQPRPSSSIICIPIPVLRLRQSVPVLGHSHIGAACAETNDRNNNWYQCFHFQLVFVVHLQNLPVELLQR
jgi:hypothetical protein